MECTYRSFKMTPSKNSSSSSPLPPARPQHPQQQQQQQLQQNNRHRRRSSATRSSSRRSSTDSHQKVWSRRSSAASNSNDPNGQSQSHRDNNHASGSGSTSAFFSLSSSFAHALELPLRYVDISHNDSSDAATTTTNNRRTSSSLSDGRRHSSHEDDYLDASDRAERIDRDPNLQSLFVAEIESCGVLTAAGYKAAYQKFLYSDAVERELQRKKRCEQSKTTSENNNKPRPILKSQPSRFGGLLRNSSFGNGCGSFSKRNAAAEDHQGDQQATNANEDTSRRSGSLRRLASRRDSCLSSAPTLARRASRRESCLSSYSGWGGGGGDWGDSWGNDSYSSKNLNFNSRRRRRSRNDSMNMNLNTNIAPLKHSNVMGPLTTDQREELLLDDDDDDDGDSGSGNDDFDRNDLDHDEDGNGDCGASFSSSVACLDAQDNRRLQLQRQDSDDGSLNLHQVFDGEDDSKLLVWKDHPHPNQQRQPSLPTKPKKKTSALRSSTATASTGVSTLPCSNASGMALSTTSAYSRLDTLSTASLDDLELLEALHDREGEEEAEVVSSARRQEQEEEEDGENTIAKQQQQHDHKSCLDPEGPLFDHHSVDGTTAELASSIHSSRSCETNHHSAHDNDDDDNTAWLPWPERKEDSIEFLVDDDGGSSMGSIKFLNHASGDELLEPFCPRSEIRARAA
mmetsp:Transcript_2640/g.4822  ORF Transcript_2640/g.4822 Transcript_2640/m.4822 type:complete len:683 (-) Transcript_2640:156-2204(-)